MAKREKPIGYGNPPKHTQFKKGQSGNPGGRPASSGSFATAIRMQGEMISPVMLDGQPASYYELIARRLCHSAVTGDLKAMALIHKIEAACGIRDGELNVEDLDIEVRLKIDEEPPPHIRARQIKFAEENPNFDPDRPPSEWGPADPDDAIH